MIRSREVVVTFSKTAMKHPIYLGLYFLIATITIITNATESYDDFNLYTRCLIIYGWMLFYYCFMYITTPIAAYHGIKWNIPLVVVIITLYTIAGIPDAIVQHKILENNGMFSVLKELLETALIIAPGVIIYLLYLGDFLKHSLCSPASDCPVWRPAPDRQSNEKELIGKVLVLQAQNQYTEVTTKERNILIRQSLSNVISTIDHGQGWQVHRSFWVRKSHVAAVKFKNGNPKVIDINKREIPISRKMVNEIQAYLSEREKKPIIEK